MRRCSALPLLALVASCAGAGDDLRNHSFYQALGHEPGWTLILDDDRLKFATSSPKTLIRLPVPRPAISSSGRRYAGPEIAVEIANAPCNDSRSGVAFRDTVTVLANGYSYQGCGGPRAPLLDR